MDDYLWLEDIESDKALNFARELNAESKKELESSPDFEPLRAKLLAIMDSKEKIPGIGKYGKHYYNFWRDDKHVRGVYRRTSLEEYRKAQPAWETVIDLDKLAEDEKENWVWHGSSPLYPKYERSLIRLSRGGKDADVVREFDLTKKEFVKDGFVVPEAKNSVHWRNNDSLFVGTDFGPGSMTTSGYPRIVKEWKRGTELNTAKTIYEGASTDVSVNAYVDHDHGHTYEFVSRNLTFYSDEVRVLRGNDWVVVDKPADSTFQTFRDFALLTLRSDWKIGDTTYKSGSLLAENFDAYMKGERKFDVLFEPTDRTALSSTSATKNYLILTELANVSSRLAVLRHEDGRWVRKEMELPPFVTASIYGVDDDENDDYFLYLESEVMPETFYIGTIGKVEREKLKSAPAFFDSEGIQVQQFEAKSKDGTMVPYFQVSKKDLKLDATNPTLLYGYGGFEVEILPGYRPGMGTAWLERGGVGVLANIRGGGEFGPKWHQAAQKENRQRAYDDFIAIAEDLIARKVTSPQHLGIQGGSNGGLLMGVMLTQRPDLFGAVVCECPLLDMQRYTHLLAGASWMEEYGDPDKPEEWKYISKYSPFQNISRDQQYPPILITTSTRDDRVHPGHARRMAARLKEFGHPVLYYENIEGGHAGASDNKQAAYIDALDYTFLWRTLK